MFKQKQVSVEFDSPVQDAVLDDTRLLIPPGHKVLARLKASLRKRGLSAGVMVMIDAPSRAWKMPVSMRMQQFELRIQGGVPYEITICDRTSIWNRWRSHERIELSEFSNLLAGMIASDGLGTNVVVKERAT